MFISHVGHASSETQYAEDLPRDRNVRSLCKGGRTAGISVVIGTPVIHAYTVVNHTYPLCQSQTGGDKLMIGCKCAKYVWV